MSFRRVLSAACVPAVLCAVLAVPPVDGTADPSPPDRSLAVRPVPPKAASFPALTTERSGPASWPAATTKVMAARAAADGVPVSVRAAPAALRITVADRSTTDSAGVAGVLIAVDRADGARVAGDAALDVDYSGFAGMYGADFGRRLTLVRYPACVLTTPKERRCTTATAVAGVTNDRDRQVLRAGKVALGGVLGVVSAAAGDSGDFQQTSLSPAYSWSAGKQGGEFTYSYPIRVPPAAGGPAPELALQYSSGSVDGRSLRQNSQASWVGMGWELNVGYIERQYRSCLDDAMGYQDLCWYSDNATMVFGGRSVALAKDAAGAWRATSDDGMKIERFAGAHNWSTRGEYWKITDTDGTQYFFGRNQGRFAGDTAQTSSAQVVPVYGNNPGEPCYNAASLYRSRCIEPYRWNLDYVVDPRGNSMTYFYSGYAGSYGGMNNTHGESIYTIAAELDHIDYGTRAGQEGTGNAPMRVSFGKTVRCTDETGANCQRQYQNWPDTPWDLFCDPHATTCAHYSPTFWTPYKLSAIQTEVWNAGTGGYGLVDRYRFSYVYPPTGDQTKPALWLNRISHIGNAAPDDAVEGGPVTMPDLQFGGDRLANRVSGGPALMHYRITVVNNEAGGQTLVNYAPVNCSGANPPWPSTGDNSMRCWPQYYQGAWVWFHKYVVDSVLERDLTGGGPDEAWHWSYSGAQSSTRALWHYSPDDIVPYERRTWSQWRGYPVVTTLHGPVGGPQTRTRELYYRGMDGDRTDGMGWRPATITDSSGTVVDHQALAGVLRESTRFDGTTEISSTVTEPMVTSPGGTYPRVIWRHRDAATRERTLLAASGIWRKTGTTYAYNGHGLPARVVDHGDEAVEGDETCVVTAYASNTQAHLVDFAAHTVTRQGTDCEGGTRIAETRTFYDGSDTLGAAPTRGLATMRQRLVTTEPDAFATTETAYDAQGRVVSDQDARGKTTTTAYTPGVGGPVTEVRTTNALGHLTTRQLDPRRGVPVRVVDANGKATVARYDAIGRLLKVWRPGPALRKTPDIEYAYLLRANAANAVTTTRTGPNGNRISSVELFDGRFRPRQTQKPAPQANGGRIVTDNVYDGRGLVTVSSTFRNSDAPGPVLLGFDHNAVARQTRTRHDLAERVTAEQLWSAGVMKWETRTSHDGDRTTVTPPSGGIPTTTVTDVRGNTVERRQQLAASPPSHQTTRYRYDLLNRLVRITDQAGNDWITGYDAGGRVVESTDPDKGRTRMTYNPAGDLLTSTDARGITLSYRYDDLGRRTSVWLGAAGTGIRRAEWIYDTLAKGRLSASKRWHEGEAYATEVTGYDDAYRTLGTRVVLPASTGPLAGPWTTATTYRPDGSIATQTYPAAGSLAAETVTTTYDDAGYALTTAGLDTYVAATAYTGWGAVERQTLGAGTKRVELRTKTDEATGRLVESRASTESQGGWAPRLVEQYAYDPAGNITGIREVDGAGVTVSNQCFIYSLLRRLDQAWTTMADTCQEAPGQSVVGGPDPYWLDYDHDIIGNRTSETIHAPGGDTTRTYEYSRGDRAFQPHAVRSITSSGAATGTETYKYDAAGNTTVRPGQTLTWDPEGHLGAIDGTRYLYTADGDRLLAEKPDGVTTLYLGDVELRRTAAGVTATRYYGGVASRSTGEGLIWHVNDHHGTGQLAIRAGDLSTTRRKLDPYGKPRGGAVEWPTSRGFVNGTQDATGLVHLGAREYDPAIGRFLSVDPVLIPEDPQQLDGYGYASGNPVAFSDPAGQHTCHGSVSGDLCPGQTKGPWGAPPPTGGQLASPTCRGSVNACEGPRAYDQNPLSGPPPSPECSAATREYCHEPGSEKSGPYGLGLDWTGGMYGAEACELSFVGPGCTHLGMRDRYFRDGDTFTRQIQDLESIELARKAIAEAIANGQYSGSQDLLYINRGPAERAWQITQDAVGILGDLGMLGLAGSLVGSPAAEAFLGSYNLTWAVVGYDATQRPVVEFSLRNATTVESATTNPVGKYPGTGDAASTEGAKYYQRQNVRWREVM